MSGIIGLTFDDQPLRLLKHIRIGVVIGSVIRCARLPDAVTLIYEQIVEDIIRHLGVQNGDLRFFPIEGKHKRGVVAKGTSVYLENVPLRADTHIGIIPEVACVKISHVIVLCGVNSVNPHGMRGIDYKILLLDVTEDIVGQAYCPIYVLQHHNVQRGSAAIYVLNDVSILGEPFVIVDLVPDRRPGFLITLASGGDEKCTGKNEACEQSYQDYIDHAGNEACTRFCRRGLS